MYDIRISGAIFKLDAAWRISYFLTNTFSDEEVSAVCNFKTYPCDLFSWRKFNTQNMETLLFINVIVRDLFLWVNNEQSYWYDSRSEVMWDFRDTIKV